MTTDQSNPPPPAADLCDRVVAGLEDAKGEDIRILDVRTLTDITDYMVIATGTSERHVKTLASRVLEYMQRAGWRHIGIEGEQSNDWVLVDFVDVVVHIMQAKTRTLYDLEGLWDEHLGRDTANLGQG